MKIGVYKLYWYNCPFYYFGNSDNAVVRHRQHILNLQAGNHYCKKLQAAFNEFGSPYVEMIAWCTKKNAIIIERSLILFHSNDINCCNVNGNPILIKERKERDGNYGIFKKIRVAIPKDQIEFWKSISRHGDRVLIGKKLSEKDQTEYGYNKVRIALLKGFATPEVIRVIKDFYDSVKDERLKEMNFINSIK